MQTHEDSNHAKEFMDRLTNRAAAMAESEKSKITAGTEGEPVLGRWKHDGMEVVHRPDDEQDIVRISIGGGPKATIRLDYCTIRGSVGDCIDLLRKAIVALREAP